jgi:hypothetical protein
MLASANKAAIQDVFLIYYDKARLSAVLLPIVPGLIEKTFRSCSRKAAPS